MTVLEVAQGVAKRIGVSVPSVLYAGTDREQVELAECLNETAAMIAFDCGHDWTKLKTLNTYTGTGAALGFDLPSDYRRMLKKAAVWSSSTDGPMTHIVDTDEWLQMQVEDFTPVAEMWTIIGEQMQIRDGGATTALASGVTAKFYYISSKYAKDSGGTAKISFTADNDSFRLNERLLKLAAIYKWKEAKGQDYGEALADYETALAEQIGNDKGSSILIVGRQRSRFGADTAFPRAVDS